MSAQPTASSDVETAYRQAELDLAASRRLPGQSTEDARALLQDAWYEGLRTGMIRRVGS